MNAAAPAADPPRIAHHASHSPSRLLAWCLVASIVLHAALIWILPADRHRDGPGRHIPVLDMVIVAQQPEPLPERERLPASKPQIRPSSAPLPQPLKRAAVPEQKTYQPALASDLPLEPVARLPVAPPVPEEMVGSLAAVELPADPHPQPQLDFTTSPTPQHMLQSRLMREHQIEVPAFYFPKHPRRLLRISAQVYNETSEYEKLAAALVGLLAELA